ncbi:hypothetical protein DUNSADRAFT_868 [Dunaliella salina]|uniref:Encoded protein n=1 Tax=Dunaliella salina TaxID=3046 RepID=A0ABQ7FY77_DUNSA|nr:hypothetical protein DUNSADRAFT_868 [Dunaliella salina]|eukprot:KAF5827313.1 hypothetical protein DUNSADRAFT_868 [Dunaliella salina]
MPCIQFADPTRCTPHFPKERARSNKKGKPQQSLPARGQVRAKKSATCAYIGRKNVFGEGVKEYLNIHKCLPAEPLKTSKQCLAKAG